MMRTNYSSRTDMLDIIFENRNKAYGAYALRRQYPGHLFKALCLGLSFAGAFIFFMTYNRNHQLQTDPFILQADTVKVGAVLQPEKPLPPPELPPNPTGPQNTIQHVVPVIVPNDIPFLDSVPTVDVQTQNAIGSATNIVEGSSPGFNTNNVQSATISTPASESATPEVYDFRIVEEPASFPGGNKALLRFMENNLRDPRNEDEELAKTIKVQVKFVVGKDGQADAFDVISSGGEVFDSEVLRVLRKMPRWKPARQHNQQVAMFFIMPVSFAANENE